MQPSQIATSYNAMAAQWLEPHLETNGIRQHEHALRFRADQTGGHALDVGSGCSGRFITLLKKHGYSVEGLDISAEMIALAKTRHPDILSHHADICEWTPPRSYDFITAWDSIWHVPLDRSELVLRKLCQALAPGGIFIWTTAGLDEPVEKHDASMGQPLYYSVLGIPRTLQILTEEGCVCRHLEHDQLPEHHVFLIAERTK